MVRLPIGYYEKEVLGISRITDRPVADSIVAIAPAGSVCAKGFLLHNAHLRMNLFPLRQRHYITTIRLSTCNCPHTALKRGRQRARPTSLFTFGLLLQEFVPPGPVPALFPTYTS
jgi:hypothetical protein